MERPEVGGEKMQPKKRRGRFQGKVPQQRSKHMICAILKACCLNHLNSNGTFCVPPN